MFKKIMWYARVQSDIKKLEANIKEMKAKANGTAMESIRNIIEKQEMRVADMKKQVRKNFLNPHFNVA